MQKVGTTGHVPGTARHPVWLEHSEVGRWAGQTGGNVQATAWNLDFILPLVGSHCDFKQRCVLIGSVVSKADSGGCGIRV